MEIRGINGLNPINNDRLNNVNSKKVSTSYGSDNVEISDEARKLAEQAQIREAVEASPDIREDKIAEVKERLQNGYYDNEEVLNDVAAKLLDVLNL